MLPTDGTTLFALFLGFGILNTLGSVAFFAIVEAALARRTRIYDVALQEGQLARELLGSMLFVLIFAAGTTLAFSSGRIEVAPYTLAGAAFTFVASLISFDIFYYGLHRLMHTRRFAAIHDWHHKSRVNTPWTALSLSPLESAAWVMALVAWPLAMSHLLPFVTEGYIAWLVFFWWSNTMGHINVEIVPGYVSANPISRLATHAITYHALHHARYQNHYCFFLNGLDELFGTVWPDYHEVHQRVVDGHPLERLGERGSTAKSASS